MTRTFEWLPVTTVASGGELHLPLHTLRGAHPGPTLGLSALVHGNEPVPSIGIIRSLLDRLDPAELRGTVLAVPVLNPYDLTVRQEFATSFARTLMLATRVAPTWCTPGEFGYIITDAGKAEVLD
jgi:predicted deacylase